MDIKSLQTPVKIAGFCGVKISDVRSFSTYGLQYLERSPFSWKKQTNTQACLHFARTKWQTVLWSDETKIELFGINSKRYVCCKNKTVYYPNDTIHTMKHGDGSIVLFLFSWDRDSSQERGNHLFGRPRHITDYQHKWHLTNNDLY